jgi:hypothetical protein
MYNQHLDKLIYRTVLLLCVVGAAFAVALGSAAAHQSTSSRLTFADSEWGDVVSAGSVGPAVPVG